MVGYSSSDENEGELVLNLTAKTTEWLLYGLGAFCGEVAESRVSWKVTSSCAPIRNDGSPHLTSQESVQHNIKGDPAEVLVQQDNPHRETPYGDDYQIETASTLEMDDKDTQSHSRSNNEPNEFSLDQLLRHAHLDPWSPLSTRTNHQQMITQELDEGLSQLQKEADGPTEGVSFLITRKRKCVNWPPENRFYVAQSVLGTGIKANESHSSASAATDDVQDYKAVEDKRRLLVEVSLRKHTARYRELALLDTGADVNVISKDLSDRLECRIKELDTKQRPETANGDKLRSMGITKLSLVWLTSKGPRRARMEFHVVSGLPVNLLLCNGAAKHHEMLEASASAINRNQAAQAAICVPIFFNHVKKLDKHAQEAILQKCEEENRRRDQEADAEKLAKINKLPLSVTSSIQATTPGLVQRK